MRGARRYTLRPGEGYGEDSSIFGRGIGTLILEACEKAAREKGRTLRWAQP
jgi:hypothetical protein